MSGRPRWLLGGSLPLSRLSRVGRCPSFIVPTSRSPPIPAGTQADFLLNVFAFGFRPSFTMLCRIIRPEGLIKLLYCDSFDLTNRGLFRVTLCADNIAGRTMGAAGTGRSLSFSSAPCLYQRSGSIHYEQSGRGRRAQERHVAAGGVRAQSCWSSHTSLSPFRSVPLSVLYRPQSDGSDVPSSDRPAPTHRVSSESLPNSWARNCTGAATDLECAVVLLGEGWVVALADDEVKVAFRLLDWEGGTDPFAVTLLIEKRLGAQTEGSGAFWHHFCFLYCFVLSPLNSIIYKSMVVHVTA